MKQPAKQPEITIKITDNKKKQRKNVLLGQLFEQFHQALSTTERIISLTVNTRNTNHFFYCHQHIPECWWINDRYSVPSSIRRRIIPSMKQYALCMKSFCVPNGPTKTSRYQQKKIIKTTIDTQKTTTTDRTQKRYEHKFNPDPALVREQPRATRPVDFSVFCGFRRG